MVVSIVRQKFLFLEIWVTYPDIGKSATPVQNPKPQIILLGTFTLLKLDYVENKIFSTA